ncbi:hypothetical protein I204_05220 [Kwoniella mangroviensis CBS 8886]|uniref:uncharacterized protein n=1 Tax=Kwoniella mangroviensis CBS 8507 TaxID=1296122 RepID=UPI00080D2C0B|nr:uncharacterized protein I203_04572 [Kwoniella mangroviensis CBS 8507]OCF66245.1 hypothetical protein I203_04572 [Kwoniella mangroviensis CBS 8507]OCF73383.1 hypothetical protein I204_05220 [Kwoniella mangroviensis CBS 8886]
MNENDILVPASSDDEQPENPEKNTTTGQTSSTTSGDHVGEADTSSKSKKKGPGKGKQAKDPGKRRRKFDDKAGRHELMQEAAESTAVKGQEDDKVGKEKGKGKEVDKKEEKGKKAEKEEEEWELDIPWIHPDNRSRATGMSGALDDQTWYEVRRSQVFGTNVERGGCMRCRMRGLACDMASPCGNCVHTLHPEGCFPDVTECLPEDDEVRSASRRYALAFAGYQKHVEKKRAEPAKPNTISDFFKPKGR